MNWACIITYNSLGPTAPPGSSLRLVALSLWLLGVVLVAWLLVVSLRLVCVVVFLGLRRKIGIYVYTYIDVVAPLLR